MGRKAKEYALYKGDSILSIGTKKEIAEELQLKCETISFYSSPTYKNRGKGKNRKILIKLDECED